MYTGLQISFLLYCVFKLLLREINFINIFSLLFYNALILLLGDEEMLDMCFYN